MRLKVVAALGVILVQVQCQSDSPSYVEALRHETFVPFSGRLQVWHNPGYWTDIVWFPAEQIGCVVLREDGDREPSGPRTRWMVYTNHQAPSESQACEAVQVPATFAAKIYALSNSPCSEEEQHELAEEGRRLGLFRIGMSDLERALRTWR